MVRPTHNDSMPESSYLQSLILLNNEIPHLRISSIEFFVDFFCADPNAVSNLFYVLRRYLWFKRKGRTRLKGGEYTGMHIARTENIVMHVSNSAGNDAKWKLYERGREKYGHDAAEQGWPHSDVIKVRLEVTLKRKDKTSTQYGLDTLDDLIERPNFKGILYDNIHFMCFKQPSTYPQEYDVYGATDMTGCVDCFQEQYLKVKSERDASEQQIVESELMRSLKERIFDAVQRAEGHWQRRARLYK